MNSEIRSIQKIIDMEKWEILQDSLASVTGMAIIVTDYKGNPVTKHSACNILIAAVIVDSVQKRQVKAA